MPRPVDEIIDPATIRVFVGGPGFMADEIGIGATPRDQETYGPTYWIQIFNAQWAPLILRALMAHAVEHGFEIPTESEIDPDYQDDYIDDQAFYDPPGDFGPPIFDEPIDF